MVKVRKALEKVGVDVRTEWGSGGWAIPLEHKAKPRRLMSDCVAPADDLRARRLAFVNA
jgi:hypothetical protein